jgi:hypothetical protein
VGYGIIGIKALGRLWSWLFAGDYRLLLHGKQRLRFDDGALLGKSVESMKMKLVVMSFVIDQAEGNQIGSGPLRIRHKNAALLGHLYQITMRLTIKIDAHRLNLKVHHVTKPLGPSAGMRLLAAKRKPLNQPTGRKHLVRIAYHFRKAISFVKNADNMRTTGNPNDYFIVALEKLSAAINIEQFRM